MKDFWVQLRSNDELCKAQIEILSPLLVGFKSFEQFNFSNIEYGNRQLEVLSSRKDWFHNLMSPDRDKPQLTIEQAIEELQKKEPEYKEGDWVFHANYKYPIKINKIRWGDGEFEGKPSILEGGINAGKYLEHMSIIYITSHARADEIEKHLIEEAEKRGLIKGAKYTTPNKRFQRQIINTPKDFAYNLDEDVLSDGSNVLYRRGDWAEVIKDEIKINGYKMELQESIIKFGCAELARNPFRRAIKQILKFNEVGRGNREIKSIKLDSGVEISAEQLKQILDKMNELN